MYNLKGKVVVITGGTSGIGYQTAMAFKEQGAHVVVTASTEDSAAIAHKKWGEHIDVIKTDITHVDEIGALYEKVQKKYNKIDVLFANAGIGLQTPTANVNEQFYDSHFDINVKGVYFTVAKALPYLNKGSSVIITSSVLGVKGIPNASVYAATKAAVRSFARSWTAEFPVNEVRFNVISPGPIDTPMHGKIGMSPEQLQGYIHGISQMVPAKRFGSPEEVANLVLFLASDKSKYIAGSEIAIDGGFAQI